MKTDVERELLDILTGYLLKEKSLKDFTEWFVELKWEEAQKILGLGYLAFDVREGLHPESDFWEKAAITVQSLLGETTRCPE